VLGGDYIWHPDEAKIWAKTNADFHAFTHSEVPAAVFERVAQIFTGRPPADGVVAVLGNHDGWIDPAACRQIFSRRGIEVLENRSHTIRRGDATLDVIGVADLWTGFPQIPPGAPRSPRHATVLVSHNPDFVSERLSEPGFAASLAVCGHTHGGQIRLPFGGVIFDNVDDKRFVSGLVHVGETAVFTSKGVGVVEIPLRVNCPPDVARLVLRRHTS
jgi:predicted MPP superfamily phosphohydrolase